MDCLLDETRCSIVSGEAYFVTDGNPSNTFLFYMRHLIPAVRGEGARCPTLQVPLFIVFLVAYAITLVARVMGKRFRMPTMGATVNEVTSEMLSCP